MKQASRTLVLLYVLLAYVFVQFLWWGYLIYDLNAELILTNELLEGKTGSSTANAESEIRAKLLMIMGEGSVFFLLLIIGSYYISKYIQRTETLNKQERNFLMTTTHEFNSPIAAIKLNLQTLQRQDLTPGQISRVADGALHANQRLESLVGNILMASRLDAGKLQLMTEPVDLIESLQQLSSRYDALIKQSDCSINFECPEGLTVNTDRMALETILGNLIENALKYAPGKSISIKASDHDKKITITVADEGPGIPSGDLKHIFKKFYRVENEETRTTKGTGLGLYLVKQLVASLGGSIHIKSNVPYGTKFILSIKNHGE